MLEDIRREAFEMARAARSGELDATRARAAAACLQVAIETAGLELQCIKLGIALPQSLGSPTPGPVTLEHEPRPQVSGAIAAATKEEPKAAPKTRLPRALLLGVTNAATKGAITAKFNNTLEPVFWDDEGMGLDTLRSLAKRADFAVVRNGGPVSHSHTEMVESCGCRVTGGGKSATSVIDAIRRELEKMQ